MMFFLKLHSHFRNLCSEIWQLGSSCTQVRSIQFHQLLYNCPENLISYMQAITTIPSRKMLVSYTHTRACTRHSPREPSVYFYVSRFTCSEHCFSTMCPFMMAPFSLHSLRRLIPVMCIKIFSWLNNILLLAHFIDVFIRWWPFEQCFVQLLKNLRFMLHV